MNTDFINTFKIKLKKASESKTTVFYASYPQDIARQSLEVIESLEKELFDLKETLSKITETKD